MLRRSRRATLVFGFFLALRGAALAQGSFLLPQGHTPSALSGGGLSSAFGVSVSDVGGVNPAALGAFNRAEVGLTYTMGTATEVARDVKAGPINGVRPQSVAVVSPLGAWVLGVGYNQRYAAEMDFGCAPRSTNENPDIEPSEWCAVQTARLETFSPQAVYRVVRADGSTLDVGIRFGIGRGSMNSQIDDVTGTFSEWGVQAAAGVRYRADRYGLAAYYESALRVEGEVEVAGGLEPVDLPGSGPGDLPSYNEVRSAAVSGAIPARLGFGLVLDATPTLAFGADLLYALWQSEDDDLYENQVEGAAWGRLDLSGRSLVSFGVLMQGRHPASNGLIYSGRALYMTAGGALTLDRLRLDAVVADSRLLSAENHRQTIVKVGASVRF